MSYMPTKRPSAAKTASRTDQLDKYCNQLKLLNEKVAGGNPAKDDEIRIVLYEISL